MSIIVSTVRKYLDSWRNLRAWGQSLDDVDLVVVDRNYRRRLGTAWPSMRRVNIYLQDSAIKMLKTGVHEFAHIAVPEGKHGYGWQKVYAGAVMEITGEYVTAGISDFREVDNSCYYAMKRWWDCGRV